MWDPNIGMGTVTHQNIGYLWPMGPFYWLFDVARRARLDRAAHLARVDPVPRRRSASATCCARSASDGPASARRRSSTRSSPYVLTLAARLSVILLPFAALPWLIAFTVQALRDRRLALPRAVRARRARRSASINATALAARRRSAPLLWFAVRVCWSPSEVDLAPRRSAPWCASACSRSATRSGGWPGCGARAATASTPPVHETAHTVATASTAPEVLRGLGYWFFYGGDKLGPWIEPSGAVHAEPGC